MATWKTIQLLLLCLLAVGGCLYFVMFLRQNVTPKVQESCHDTKEWCKNLEVAKTCGVLEFCNMKWKTADINGTEAVEDGIKPLAVDVYFESFCPDSVKFITEQLYPTYEKLLGKNIFTVDLIPYGNAKETKKDDHWEFSCQHGEEECLGNLIETCAIHEFKNISIWMPFIFCMEGQKATLKVAKQCSEDLHIDFGRIEKCRTGKIGNELEHKMALKTEGLTPKHTFIPWITINGKSEGLQTKALYDFFHLICETYKGPKPNVCKK